MQSLGRTLLRWKHQIAAWHRSHVSNGPTEAANNLLKRVKRVAFGFTSFRNYRIRVLLYAGKPTGTYSRQPHRAHWSTMGSSAATKLSTLSMVLVVHRPPRSRLDRQFQ